MADRRVPAMLLAIALVACSGDGGSGPDDDRPPDVDAVFAGTVSLGAETCTPDVFSDPDPATSFASRLDIDQDGEELEAVDRDQMNFPFEGEIDDLGNVELSASITDTVEITSGNDTIPARRTTTVNLDLRRSADGERLSGDVRVDEAFTLIAANEFLSTCTQVGTMVLTRQGASASLRDLPLQ